MWYGIWILLFLVHVQSIKCLRIQNSNKDGVWTPISNEEILYRYTNSNPTTEYIEFTTPSWKPTEVYDSDNIRKSNNKTELLKNIYDSDSADYFQEDRNNVSCKISGSQNCSTRGQYELEDKDNKLILRVSRFQRRLKTESSTEEDNFVEPTADKYKYTKTKKPDNYIEENKPVKDLVSEQTKVQDSTGYVYDPPPVKDYESIKLGNEYKNIFQNILSKYGIKSEDKLSNYELSRKPLFAHENLKKNQNILYLPVPITQLPYQGHNSPYYVPVNPLLALFLSNFGYHLPGYHLNRINGKYTNLYGNLASNNFHNNQPFGAYKMSSDYQFPIY